MRAAELCLLVSLLDPPPLTQHSALSTQHSALSTHHSALSTPLDLLNVVDKLLVTRRLGLGHFGAWVELIN